MDGALDTFWIKSQNVTFIALQIKSFGPQKIQISSSGKKVPFGQFFRIGWYGCARTYLQLRLRQWGADNVYLLVLFS